MDSLCLLPIRQLLSKAKVSKADMSLTVQQDVLRLQVSVDYFFGVKVLNSTYDLRGVEEACGIAESPATA